MEEVTRNDPCHCGSGIKYKKCCLENDSSEFVKSIVGEAIELRPGALRTLDLGYIPAMVCCDRNRDVLTVIALHDRETDVMFAVDVAEEALSIAPRAPSRGAVSKECLVYLYGLGYRMEFRWLFPLSADGFAALGEGAVWNAQGREQTVTEDTLAACGRAALLVRKSDIGVPCARGTYAHDYLCRT